VSQGSTSRPSEKKKIKRKKEKKRKKKKKTTDLVDMSVEKIQSKGTQLAGGRGKGEEKRILKKYSWLIFKGGGVRRGKEKRNLS